MADNKIERTFVIEITPREAAEAVAEMGSDEMVVFFAALLRRMDRVEWNKQLAYVVDAHGDPAVNHDALEMLGLFGKWGTP